MRERERERESERRERERERERETVYALKIVCGQDFALYKYFVVVVVVTCDQQTGGNFNRIVRGKKGSEHSCKITHTRIEMLRETQV